jgi:ketopantoate reductase
MSAADIAVLGCGPLGRLIAAAAAAAGLRVWLACMRLRSLHSLAGGIVRVAARGGVSEARVAKLSLLEARIEAPLVVNAARLEVLEQAERYSRGDVVLYVQPSPALESRLPGPRAGLLAYYGCSWINREVGAVEYAAARLRIALPREVSPVARRVIEEIVAGLEMLGIQGSLLDSTRRLSLLWDYIAAHAATQPVASVLGTGYSRLSKSRHAVSLVDSLAREILLLVDEKGVEKIRSSVDAAREMLSVSGCRPKMLSDLEAGVSTEADWLNGAIVKEALRHGLYAPYNDSLYLQVKALEEILETRPVPGPVA